MAQGVIGDVGNVAGDLFGTKFSIASIALILLNVDRGEDIALDKVFVKEDSVFIVVTFPGHIGDDDIIAESKFGVIGSGTVGNNLPPFNRVTFFNNRNLINAGGLIRANKFL